MGKTITTYLIDGNPQGVQYVTISNRTCKMFVIPRASLSSIKEREDLKQPALYILIGDNEEFTPMAYIGESENFFERIKNHDNKKGFWQKALVFIANDKAINKADIQYLEHLSVGLAKKAKRYSISDNKQIPKAPNLSEHQKDTIEDFFNDAKMLTSFIHCSIFEIAEQKNNHLFYMKERGCDAKGFYDETGFTVLQGSILSKNTVPSFRESKQRELFIKEFATLHNDKLTLESNYTFPSPSAAANFCAGCSSNGWKVWKDSQGKTLDIIYRQQLD